MCSLYFLSSPCFLEQKTFFKNKENKIYKENIESTFDSQFFFVLKNMKNIKLR